MNLDLNKIESWVFDLDNTLYSSAYNLQKDLSIRIGDYIMKYIGLNHDDAKNLQKQYFLKYGTTLMGLMENEKIDPMHYLDFVHDLDCSVLKEDLELANLLKSLNGRKFIHSNADYKHCLRVMEKLKIADCFEGVFDIILGDFIPKPNKYNYMKLLKHHEINPKHAIMFEDIAVNLKIPYELGYQTVFVKSDMQSHDDYNQHNDFGYIHATTPDIHSFLKRI